MTRNKIIKLLDETLWHETELILKNHELIKLINQSKKYGHQAMERSNKK